MNHQRLMTMLCKPTNPHNTVVISNGQTSDTSNAVAISSVAVISNVVISSVAISNVAATSNAATSSPDLNRAPKKVHQTRLIPRARLHKPADISNKATSSVVISSVAISSAVVTSNEAVISNAVVTSSAAVISNAVVISSVAVTTPPIRATIPLISKADSPVATIPAIKEAVIGSSVPSPNAMRAQGLKCASRHVLNP